MGHLAVEVRDGMLGVVDLSQDGADVLLDMLLVQLRQGQVAAGHLPLRVGRDTITGRQHVGRVLGDVAHEVGLELGLGLEDGVAHLAPGQAVVGGQEVAGEGRKWLAAREAVGFGLDREVLFHVMAHVLRW